MGQFDDLFSRRIPLDAASEFFLGIKEAAAQTAVPVLPDVTASAAAAIAELGPTIKMAALRAKLAAAQDAVRQQYGVPVQSADEIVAAEEAGAAEQAAAEVEDLRRENEELGQVAAQNAEAAEQAATQTEMTQQELQGAQQQLQDLSMQAQQTMAQAQQAEASAAAESDAKSRLAIRIQQIRQQLSGIVASDPVAEEGADAPALQTPGQGGVDPMTGEALPPAADPNAAPGASGAPADPAQAAAPAAKPKAKETGKKSPAAVEVKVAADLAKATGLRRFGQLLSGSRAKALETASLRNEARVSRFGVQADRARDVAALRRTKGLPAPIHAPGKAGPLGLTTHRRMGAVADKMHDKATNLSIHAKNEAAEVSKARRTVGKGVAGVTAAAGLGTAAYRATRKPAAPAEKTAGLPSYLRELGAVGPRTLKNFGAKNKAVGERITAHLEGKALGKEIAAAPGLQGLALRGHQQALSQEKVDAVRRRAATLRGPNLSERLEQLKAKKVASVDKAKGLKRVGQLLSGSRVSGLRDARENLFRATVDNDAAVSKARRAYGAHVQEHGIGTAKDRALNDHANLLAESGDALRRLHKGISAERAVEQLKVIGTQLGTGVAAGGATVAGVAASHKKTASIKDIANRIVAAAGHEAHRAGHSAAAGAAEAAIPALRDAAGGVGHNLAAGALSHVTSDAAKRELGSLAHHAGHEAAAGALKNPETKKQLDKAVRTVSGSLVGAGALAGGATLYDGRKTRKALKEHTKKAGVLGAVAGFAKRQATGFHEGIKSLQAAHGAQKAMGGFGAAYGAVPMPQLQAYRNAALGQAAKKLAPAAGVAAAGTLAIGGRKAQGEV